MPTTNLADLRPSERLGAIPLGRSEGKMSYRDEIKKIVSRYAAMSEEELAAAACSAVGIEEEPSLAYDPLASDRLCRAAQAKDWIVSVDRRQFGCFVQVATPPHTNDPFVASITFGTADQSPCRVIAEAVAQAGAVE